LFSSNIELIRGDKWGMKNTWEIKEITQKLLVKRTEGRHRLEDLDIDGGILKRILKK
jgi:hypothetical protein